MRGVARPVSERTSDGLSVGTCPHPHGTRTGRTWHIVPHSAVIAGAGTSTEIDRELAAYYQRIIPELEAAKWLAKAGIPYPDSFEWSVSFRFTSNGEPFFVSGDEADKNKWFSLSVELFGRVLSMEIIQGSQAIRFVYITLTNSFTGYGMKSMAIFCTTINI